MRHPGKCAAASGAGGERGEGCGDGHGHVEADGPRRYERRAGRSMVAIVRERGDHGLKRGRDGGLQLCQAAVVASVNG
jgi:hypothetical protein